jgi:UDP-N-acetylmuramate dehydrogenase
MCWLYFNRAGSELMIAGELQSLAKARGLGQVPLQEEPLSRHTSFRIGGPADFYTVIRNEHQLCGWVVLAREIELPCLIMGRGTNLLVADKGFRGLVVENRALDFAIDDTSDTVHAEAGVPVAALARETAARGYAGLEWAIGIPGTIGGAIVSNAGAFDGSMADVVRRVSILDQAGQIRELTPRELSLGYRTSRFREKASREEAILSANLSLAPESTEVLRRRMIAYDSLRRERQPTKPSAGSVFKNPPGLFAGQLIEEAGLKGRAIGEAQVSSKHANYIVNLGSAKAEDVQRLISLIREEIWMRFDVQLELEIELVGEWGNGRVH